ncbi:uncharacterized protein LOC107639096 [Arachis ipaensis]|uniref:uncharacterized protein LOC107639096 n=1 Tax=Arachis ipaensis TaxID=130454 RepID=UPI0007AF7C29|nr:uncharacterized protein LOC107639096 [Arachis ipaensis]
MARSSKMSFLQRLLHGPSKSPFLTPPSPHYSTSYSYCSKQESSHPQTRPYPPLTQQQLSNLNHLLPRLLSQPDHLPTALRLTSAVLHTTTPLHALPLSPLIHSLTSHPDTSPTFSLLTRLRHAPQIHHHISPIALMLLTSYFNNRMCKPALAVFRWLRRPDSPSPPTRQVYEVVVEGLCRNGFVFEGLSAARDMVVAGEGVASSCGGLREWIYRGMLKEARVEDAVELNDAILGFEKCGGSDDEEESKERVLAVLERVIARWNE